MDGWMNMYIGIWVHGWMDRWMGEWMIGENGNK